jgi:hypothetical protein
MHGGCLTLALTLARLAVEHPSIRVLADEIPAPTLKEKTLRGGPFLGYYREERYVYCLLSMGGKSGIRLRAGGCTALKRTAPCARRRTRP